MTPEEFAEHAVGAALTDLHAATDTLDSLGRLAAFIRARHETGARSAARLETGPGVWPALRAAWPPPPTSRPPADGFGGGLGRPAGILVVEDPGVPAGGWRLVDGDGTVLEEGTVGLGLAPE